MIVQWSDKKVVDASGKTWQGRIVEKKNEPIKAELRKTFAGEVDFGQILIVVQLISGTMKLSMNGPIVLTNKEWDEMHQVTLEARAELSTL